MIVRAGKFIFHEVYVAFHVVRENSYSPWICIGVYVSYGDYTNCRYDDEHEYITKEFQREVVRAGHLSGTYDFLDKWRKNHSEIHSTITKIVRYRTLANDIPDLLRRMAIRYINTIDGNDFAMMAIMLKSRDGYFPVVYQAQNQQRPEVVEALREAGLI